MVLSQKNYGKNFEQAGTFDVLIGRFRPIPAILCFFEIQKIWDFQYFWANLATLFFQNAILSKIGPRPIKNGFSKIVWVLKMGYINFLSSFDLLKFRIFMHFLC